MAATVDYKMNEDVTLYLDFVSSALDENETKWILWGLCPTLFDFYRCTIILLHNHI